MPVINLSKGQNISLAKEAPGLTKVSVGLGWDANANGADVDLDASIFGLKADGQVLNDQYFVFHGNLKSPCEGVVHTGDNLTGDGDGDDEQVIMDLSKIPSDVTELTVAVTIYEASERGQNFGQVSNAYIRILDENDVEVFKYDLSEDYSTETTVTFGRVYRHNGSWKFNAVGTGVSTFSGLVEGYGITL